MIRERLQLLSVEEVANSLTHGFGLILSLAGFVFLLVLALFKGDGWHLASSIIYGSSLVTLYAASTVYHTATDSVMKKRLQILDHCCIYLLIAGSYTPFILIAMRDGFGFVLLAVVWTTAVFGIAMKIIFRARFKAVGIVLYLVMGWLGVVAAPPLYTALGMTPLALVAAGGLSYTAGMIFFGWHSIKHNHAIFHVFVLGGSILHYYAVAFYVLH
jgi:channel protein, hemolysin III family